MMTNDAIQRLLKRARLRRIPETYLAHYTDEVRRRLQAQPSTVVRVRPALPWWRVLAPVGAVAALAAMLVLRPAPTVQRPLMLAEDTSLADELAVLSIVAPDEPVLPEDDATLLEELETLEAEPASEG